MSQAPEPSSGRWIAPSHAAPMAVVVLSLMYSGWFFHLSMDRFNSLACVLDFIHIDSACYFTAHGRFMWSNALMSGFFEHHVSPILLVVSAFYLVSDSHWFILLFQAASAGLAAIPLFYFARGALKSDLAGLLVAMAYLANGEVHRAILFDYHMYAHFPLFTFATAAALQVGKNRLAMLFAFLLLATQEDAFITLAGVGLYAAVILRDIKRAGAIWLGCAIWAGLVFLVVYPWLGAPSPEAVEIGISPAGVKMETSGFKYGIRYAWLGGSPKQIAAAFATSPIQTTGKLLAEPSRVYSWKRFSIGFLLLPFLSLTGVLILFWPSMELFLSDYEMSYRLLGHYPLLPVSTWFLAATLGVANIRRMAGLGLGSRVAGSLSVASCAALFASQSFFSFSQGALPFMADNPNGISPEVREHGRKGLDVISQIPDAASLAAHPGPLSHLNHNPNAYLFVGMDKFPFTQKKIEYVVLDGKDPHKFRNRLWQADDPRKMLLTGDFGLVAQDDHVYLFRRGAEKKMDYTMFLERFATFMGKSLAFDSRVGALSSPAIPLAPGEYEAEYIIDMKAVCGFGGGEAKVLVDGQTAANMTLDCSSAREDGSTSITLPFVVKADAPAPVSLWITGKGFSRETVFRIRMSFATFIKNVGRDKP